MCSVQFVGNSPSEEGFLEGGPGVSGGSHFKPDGKGPLATVPSCGPWPSAVERAGVKAWLPGGCPAGARGDTRSMWDCGTRASGRGAGGRGSWRV